jgi:hypothetical protein
LFDICQPLFELSLERFKDQNDVWALNNEFAFPQLKYQISIILLFRYSDSLFQLIIEIDTSNVPMKVLIYHKAEKLQLSPCVYQV